LVFSNRGRKQSIKRINSSIRSTEWSPLLIEINSKKEFNCSFEDQKNVSKYFVFMCENKNAIFTIKRSLQNFRLKGSQHQHDQEPKMISKINEQIKK
jgi:hypothetical protein